MLGHASSVITTGLFVTMIAACVYCARELWRDGTARAWVVVALMNLAMIGSRGRFSNLAVYEAAELPRQRQAN